PAGAVDRNAGDGLSLSGSASLPRGGRSLLLRSGSFHGPAGGGGGTAHPGGGGGGVGQWEIVGGASRAGAPLAARGQWTRVGYRHPGPWRTSSARPGRGVAPPVRAGDDGDRPAGGGGETGQLPG